MYVADTLNRLNEEAVLDRIRDLVDDDGDPIICDCCDEPAVMGTAIYNPADALRDPPLDGIYSVLYQCEDCRDNGHGEDDIFYCEGCNRMFVVNHPWDVVASRDEHGNLSCQKCALDNWDAPTLEDVCFGLSVGATADFKRFNGVPGKALLWEGEFSEYPDFPGYTSLGSVSDAIRNAAEGVGIDPETTVYPVLDHGYQFSVSLAVYY